MIREVFPKLDIHPMDCPCGDCEPPHPTLRPRFADALRTTSAQVLAGLALGQLAVTAFAWATGGNPLVVFGL